MLDDIVFSQRVFDRNGNLLRIALTPDQKYRICTPLDQIPREMISATLLYEDRFYERHPGINPVAAVRCAWRFCFGSTRRAGASTITMQVARMRFGIHSRTLRGKFLQVLRALEIERHYSKAQILDAYFNLAPYGRNIEGIGAASEIYFGKSPAKLSLHEAVALSVIPQHPALRTPRTDRENPALMATQNRLLELIRGEKPDEPNETFSPRARPARTFLAPHFTTEILREQRTQTDIVTTLDNQLQQISERCIRGYIASRKNVGIKNAAAMLVDFHSMDVLAQVGSADFFSDEILGQIDGTRSARSPGSTLKPFVYALAMEQGIIHPLSMVKDAPRSFAGYNPENFDREFLGPISATDALARSRNVPAVELASRLAHPTLYEFLKRAGVRLPNDEKSYGLALPLGDAEVTMEDLVRLYCALANDGRLRNLRCISMAKNTERSIRILTPESSFLALEMLGHAPRPGDSTPTSSESVFWKTGTSHGYHDAWSVAVFDRFVLTMWIGNFDGRANPAFIGRSAAAPLLFQIIDAVRAHEHTRPAPHEPPPDANLQQVEFCAVSGELPTAACPHRVRGWFIPGISPITQCSVHREILVDVNTGLRVAKDDGMHALRREVYEFWPSDLLALFEKAGLPRRLPPPFLPDSEVDELARRGHPPRITSPKNAVQYSIRAKDASNTGFALRAETETDATKLYWFADKSFLGSASAGGTLYWRPTPGTYKLIALDNHGRSGARSVTIVAAEAN